MKQTAVEWLFNKLWDTNHITQYTTQGVDSFELLEQAKAMEKEQIIDSFGVGCQVESTRLIGYHKMAEQYYNETYGK